MASQGYESVLGESVHLLHLASEQAIDREVILAYMGVKNQCTCKSHLHLDMNKGVPRLP